MLVREILNRRKNSKIAAEVASDRHGGSAEISSHKLYKQCPYEMDRIQLGIHLNGLRGLNREKRNVQ